MNAPHRSGLERILLVLVGGLMLALGIAVFWTYSPWTPDPTQDTADRLNEVMLAGVTGTLTLFGVLVARMGLRGEEPTHEEPHHEPAEDEPYERDDDGDDDQGDELEEERAS